MKAKCSLCNKYWNVSIYAQFPKGGYLCPRCRQERKVDETTSRQTETKKTNGNVKKKDCEKKEQGRKRR